MAGPRPAGTPAARPCLTVVPGPEPPATPDRDGERRLAHAARRLGRDDGHRGRAGTDRGVGPGGRRGQVAGGALGRAVGAGWGGPGADRQPEARPRGRAHRAAGRGIRPTHPRRHAGKDPAHRRCADHRYPRSGSRRTLPDPLVDGRSAAPNGGGRTFGLMWIAGLMRRRWVRLAGATLGVALAVTFVASLGSFFVASKAHMTQQALV